MPGPENGPDRDETAAGILFACNMNSIRSPMAEAIARHLLGPDVLIDSVGVYEGGPDPFVEMILAEDGIALGEHEAKTFEEIDPSRFGTAIMLTDEAVERAGALFPPSSVEFWPIPNPTDERGSRDQLMAAYRAARDALKMRIISRFGALVP
ncbi:low molecular weight phosphatase family protein [Aquisalinus flavus]|uniref:Protein-tyrosine-phosphatase n=1 Tax=Aquisalinus flavus TaxID=1526572 RepID=A0A8J2V734_9PROT|nr:low molecular weight phosphatase family protein [Aquisalinus flavus]MBD0427390.1 low molecular weight phosphatase family protein [Aquisalinus flavus]UNE47193.1 low molecular weight phosphatase family protein [Aquisalinus flavus]GGD00609.1 protein-tyrosine-phosphatase [Aquisalinus flavus]